MARSFFATLEQRVVENRRDGSPVFEGARPDGVEEVRELRRRHLDCLVDVQRLLGHAFAVVSDEVVEIRVGKAVCGLEAAEIVNLAGLVARLLSEFSACAPLAVLAFFETARRQPVILPFDGVSPLVDDDDVAVCREGEDHRTLALGQVIELGFGAVRQSDRLVDDVEPIATVGYLFVQRLPAVWHTPTAASSHKFPPTARVLAPVALLARRSFWRRALVADHTGYLRPGTGSGVTDWPPLDPTDGTAVADRRDELVAAVTDHAGQIADQLARLAGGDYGQTTIETDRGEWTVKYEAGGLSYLRFDPDRGEDVYVVSTKQPPEPGALADALTDYSAFVVGFNEYVASIDGLLDDISTEFPDVASTDRAVTERDRVLGRIRDVCDRIAREHQRCEGGDYGTFTTRVTGTRWELNWDRDGVSYLRVGGENGVYLLSQYQPPSADDIREHAPHFPKFVRAYNEEIADLASGLERIEL
ncbi:MAG: hypothetical protein ACI8TL_000002 [Natronomonas sp.]